MILSKPTGIIMGPVTYLLGIVFNAIYNVFFNMGVHSIALSIVVFTVIVRLLMFPLNLQTTRSSKVQQFLKPEFDKINKKYKGKQEQADLLAKQRETQELQQKYGLKMSTGCLVSLLQFPIFIGLYNVIQNIPTYVSKINALYTPISDAIYEATNGHDILVNFAESNSDVIKRLTFKVAEIGDFTATADVATVKDRIIDIIYRCNDGLLTKLSEVFNESSPSVVQAISDNRDKIAEVNHFLLGINLAEAPGFKLSPAIVIPILATGFQLLSMMIVPNTPTGDPQQDAQMQTMKRMMYITPIIFFTVTVNAPAGLGLYWATSSLISCLITFFTNVYYNHIDMEKLVEKMRVKAEAKNAKRKASGKKSFYERMMEGAYGNAAEAEESRETNKGYGKIANMNLKNMESPVAEESEEASDIASEATEAAEEVSKNVENTFSSNKKQPRKGSLADKVNAVNRFNNSGDK